MAHLPPQVLDEIDVFADDKTRAYILNVIASVFEETRQEYQYIVLSPHGMGPVEQMLEMHQQLRGKLQIFEIASRNVDA